MKVHQLFSRSSSLSVSPALLLGLRAQCETDGRRDDSTDGSSENSFRFLFDLYERDLTVRQNKKLRE